jgi:hypothetical protein
MEILRQKVKADKKLLVDQDMQLTEAEAKGFGPYTRLTRRSLTGSTSGLAV